MSTPNFNLEHSMEKVKMNFDTEYKKELKNPLNWIKQVGQDAPYIFGILLKALLTSMIMMSLLGLSATFAIMALSPELLNDPSSKALMIEYFLKVSFIVVSALFGLIYLNNPRPARESIFTKKALERVNNSKQED